MDPIYYWLIENRPEEWTLRKVQILEAVIHSLASEGVEEFSFEKLGKQLGMARSHIVYYFKDREALFKEALGFIATSAQLVTIQLWTKAPPEEKFRAIFEGAFAWAERLRDHAVAFALLQYFAARKPEYRELMTRIRSEGQRRIGESLQLAYPKRFKASELPATSRALQLLMSSYIGEFFLTSNYPTLAEAKAECWREIEKRLAP